MLAEIFMLRMEANLRSASVPTPGGDTRFVPVDPAKLSQQIDSSSQVLNPAVVRSTGCASGVGAGMRRG